MNDQTPLSAYYDIGTLAVVINNLTVDDRAVVTESRRWSTGRRGAAVGNEGGRQRPADPRHPIPHRRNPRSRTAGRS